MRNCLFCAFFIADETKELRQSEILILDRVFLAEKRCQKLKLSEADIISTAEENDIVSFCVDPSG